MKYKYLFLTATFGLGSLYGAENFKESNVIRNEYKVIDGGIVSTDAIATLPVEQHYNRACASFNSGDWPEAARQFYIVSLNFPNTTYGHDALFYQGIANYHLEDYDIANRLMKEYLNCQSNPKYFLQAMEYKLAIAEQFRCGAKRYMFGTKYMPKWATGRTMALDIYDEVIAAMPSHELAAQALFSKGCLLWELQEYGDSVEAFQTLIRRFPKHEYAPESYLFINKIYFAQATIEYQNSDFLALANINLRRFKESFPQEERLKEAEEDVLAIKEVYAKGLYDTGKFYEKICQPSAAAIYYKKALNDYPDTNVAALCTERLNAISS
jgi:outer membrane protein assembly factor BamD (BamD/ComL family)